MNQRHGETFSNPETDSNWMLDPRIIFLNHGSFGSCPRPVLEFQQEIRNRLEREPIQFLVRDLEPLLDTARGKLAAFLNADAENLVFVQNATSGINTVLRSLQFSPGDELLVTNHEYNASRNALEFVAERSGARVVVADVPFPVHSEDEILNAILARVSPRTRLALIDHVTSQTGLIFPVERLVREFSARGIETLVDGAHAPGMVPVDLKKIGATYYTGNCHKWICAPKTAAFLYVQPEKQNSIRPLIISNGATSPRKDRSRFLIEFAWTGTTDFSAALSVPRALSFMESLAQGGWPEIMRRNRAMALAARRILCDALEIPLPCPDELIGSMASFPIWDATENPASKNPPLDSLQEKLCDEYSIEVPVISWPKFPKRLLRISAQIYNSLPQYEELARALKSFVKNSR